MSYEAEISRRHPAAFFFVLDQSASMDDPVAGVPSKKSVMLATVVNRVINELCVRNQEGDEVLSRFEIALVGYGNERYGPTRVGSAFGGSLAGRAIVPLKDVADYPLRIDNSTKTEVDASGNLVKVPVKFPVWLEPEANAGTPMAEAMSYTFQLVADWVAAHQDSFPPVVIHVTDGEPNDGIDPRPQADAIRDQSTNDGNVLMFTLHLSGGAPQPITFPENEALLPDMFSRMLFHMSSPMPGKWRVRSGEHMGLTIGQNARAFIYNADITSMIQFLEIGTRNPAER